MSEIISKFEKSIASFFGAPFGVATDSCTHAIELCLRYNKIRAVTCPNHTYLSVPFTFEKLNLKWSFENYQWKEKYIIGNTNIVDAAVLWKENSYIPDTFMCVSFQFKKHLNLGRGGIILCNNKEDADALRKLTYDGRDFNKPWTEQNIKTIGYHYYMTPETAQLGLDKLPDAIATRPKYWSWQDYPDLKNMEVFNELYK